MSILFSTSPFDIIQNSFILFTPFLYTIIIFSPFLFSEYLFRNNKEKLDFENIIKIEIIKNIDDSKIEYIKLYKKNKILLIEFPKELENKQVYKLLKYKKAIRFIEKK